MVQKYDQNTSALFDVFFKSFNILLFDLFDFDLMIFEYIFKSLKLNQLNQLKLEHQKFK